MSLTTTCKIDQRRERILNGACREFPFVAFSRSLLQKDHTMDETEIYSRLGQVFEDVFGDDTIRLTPELAARDVDGWDSIAHVRLMLSIERAFKIKIHTSEIGTLESVGDLAALIRLRA